MTGEEIVKIAKGLRTDFKCESDIMVDFCNSIIKELEQEPTTENNLRVDCVSRQAVIDMTGLSEWFDSSDSYNEFVIALSELPSVTPQKPRKGKWTKLSNTIPCMNCPICGSTFTLILGGDKMHYCPNCGADMKEVKE